MRKIHSGIKNKINSNILKKVFKIIRLNKKENK